MLLTQNDVKNDIDLIINNVNRGENLIPSTLNALKISSILPATCLALYALTLAYNVFTFTPPVDDAWINPVMHYLGGMLAFGAFTFLLSLGVVGGLYGPAMAYLALPLDVRKKSLILKELKGTFKRTGGMITVINLFYAVLCVFYPDAFYGAPVVFLLSFIALQLVMSTQISRYGLAGLMQNIAKLAKKI